MYIKCFWIIMKKETTYVSDDGRSSPDTGRWSGSPDCGKNQGDERGFPSNRVTWSGEAPADVDGECQWLPGSSRTHPCHGVQTHGQGARQTPVNKPWVCLCMCECVCVCVNQCVISVYKVLCKVRSIWLLSSRVPSGCDVKLSKIENTCLYHC